MKGKAVVPQMSQRCCDERKAKRRIKEDSCRTTVIHEGQNPDWDGAR